MREAWQEAQDAQKQTNDYRLDKNHTFSVCMYDDFEKYGRVPESYSESEERPYVARVGLSHSQDRQPSSFPTPPTL